MLEVKLQIDRRGKGAFILEDDNKRLGEMEIGISNNILTAYHTEVVREMEGKGGAKKLLEAMVEYARTNKLKVNPLCPYVLSMFKRYPEKYKDLWNKEK